MGVAIDPTIPQACLLGPEGASGVLGGMQRS